MATPEGTMDLVKGAPRAFNYDSYLATEGPGRRFIHLKPGETLFRQGISATCVFFLVHGRAKLSCVSAEGREAVLGLVAPGEFIGEEAIASPESLCSVTASALTSSVALKIERDVMVEVLRQERCFAEGFLQFLLLRGMRAQANHADQLFNSSEKRLARALLLMADCERPGEHDGFVPSITQEDLAEMIGTTRSRVSFFMNRFRKLGLIDYGARILVHRHQMMRFLDDPLPASRQQSNPDARGVAAPGRSMREQSPYRSGLH